jgi:predicted RNA-binding Zn ribbon-like protein
MSHHHHHPHPPAIFIADSAALDFLNSIATPTDAQIDWIDDGAGLLAWLRQADLAPSNELERLREAAMPGEMDGVAAQARALREWFRGFVRDHMGRPLTAQALRALEPLNRLLARDETYTRIVAAPSGPDGSLEKQVTRRWRSPESLLLPIAQALADFVCSEDFTNVKACEGARCTLMFADHTRGRRRRFCSAAVCGNRAKVAAHRKRAKEIGAR